jgi:hypothetical protein
VEALLRQLTLGGAAARVVAGATVLALAGALAAIVLGTRASRRRGLPRRAILAAVALALPLGLIFGFGLEASRFAPSRAAAADPATAVAAFRADLAVRRLTGWAGLALALPLGGAAGLWAGIAAARRTRRAGERARLAAQAAGDVETGQAVASALDHSRSPEIGGAIGILAGISLTGIPSVGLLLSTTSLDQTLVDLIHLDRFAAPLFLRLAVAGAARPLLAAAAAGAIGAVAAGFLLGTAIHAASSRRRNLAVATRILGLRQATPETRSAVTRALAATGKPGPVAPALIAVTLLILAALALAEAASLAPAAAAPSAEGVAAASSGR